MASLTRISARTVSALVVDIADQFERVRSVADGEREYSRG